VTSESPIRVKVGRMFEISQSANPTTGFKWIPTFDRSLVDLNADTFERNSPGTGRGGKQIFTFLAKRKGTTTVRLEYKRPWDQSSLKLYTSQVIIE